MKKQAGLWIDHRKSMIVVVSEVGEVIKEITSNMEKKSGLPVGQLPKTARPKTCGIGSLGNI